MSLRRFLRKVRRSSTPESEASAPSSSSQATAPSAPAGNSRTRFRKLLTENFTAEELVELSLELGIDYDKLRGTGHRTKVVELIVYTMRRGRLSELVSACQRRRPDVAWEAESLLADEAAKAPVAAQTALETPPMDPSAAKVAASSGESAPPGSMPYRGELQQLLLDCFSKSDLVEICFDVGIDFEDFPGRDKVGEVAIYLERQRSGSELQEQLAGFIVACRERRPDIDWAEAAGIESSRRESLAPFYPYGYRTGAVRTLLLESFKTNEDLAAFCRAYFPPASYSLGSAMAHRESVQSLLGYFTRRGRLDELLAALKESQPDEYSQYYPYGVE